MAMNLRSAVGIAAIWVATVVGVSATAWFAIDRAGRGLGDSGVSSVTAQSRGAPNDPTTNDAATRSTATGSTATPGSNPSPSVTGDSPTATSQAQRDRSVTVTGGQVSARCTGETILLRIAQPSNGWRVDVMEVGPRVLDLTFERGDEGAEGETRVKAVCASGTPKFTLENKD